MVHGYMDRFVVHVLLGDIPGAHADLAAMTRIADELRQPVQLWQVCIARAMLALGLGKLSEGKELVAEALELGERPHPEMAIPAHRVQWYTLCELSGTPEKAESAIVDLVADYPKRPVFRCVLAHLHARLGRADEAQQELAELARDGFSALPFDQEWLYGMSLLAETAATLRDTDVAMALYPLLKPWEALNAADHPEAMRGSVSRHLGLLSAVLERLDQASAHYEAAVSMNTKMGARPWLAGTQDDYAMTLLARGAPGDSKRASQLRDAARATYRELGMSTQAAKLSSPAPEIATT
jgi:tetratricopeptide (TPR) repeat protein